MREVWRKEHAKGFFNLRRKKRVGLQFGWPELSDGYVLAPLNPRMESI